MPVASQSIGTLVVHPIDMIGAYGAIANSGVLMPRHTILKVLDDKGVQVWPPQDLKGEGTRVVSRRRSGRPAPSIRNSAAGSHCH